MARVLIVEREAQIRKLLKTILDYAGHEVLTAPDSQVAIEMCNASEASMWCSPVYPCL